MKKRKNEPADEDHDDDDGEEFANTESMSKKTRSEYKITSTASTSRKDNPMTANIFQQVTDIKSNARSAGAPNASASGSDSPVLFKKQQQQQQQQSNNNNDFVARLGKQISRGYNVTVASRASTSASSASSEQSADTSKLRKGKESYVVKSPELLPLDWSIKTVTRFTSMHSFEWCSHLSSLSHSCGVTAFVKGEKCDLSPYDNPRGCTQQQDVQSRMCSEFVKSLLYYTCPSFPLPKSVETALSSMRKDSVSFEDLGADAPFIESRLEDWTEGFKSIYYMLRNGQCPYFYTLISHPVRFSALFIAGGVCGADTDVRVMISNSTRGLRTRLTEAGIVFDHQQISNATAIQGEDTEASPDSAGLTDGGSDGAGTGSNNNNNSGAILLVGRHKVHKLFNFLLNYTTEPAIVVHDVPVILSPVTFVNSTLRSVRITNNGRVADKDLNSIYTLELEGPMLPHSLLRLCEIFAETQQDEFKCHFVSIDERTVTHNNSNATHGKLARSMTQQMALAGSQACHAGMFHWLQADVRAASLGSSGTGGGLINNEFAPLLRDDTVYGDENNDNGGNDTPHPLLLLQNGQCLKTIQFKQGMFTYTLQKPSTATTTITANRR